jgi:hypothetical protein
VDDVWIAADKRGVGLSGREVIGIHIRHGPHPAHRSANVVAEGRCKTRGESHAHEKSRRATEASKAWKISLPTLSSTTLTLAPLISARTRASAVTLRGGLSHKARVANGNIAKARRKAP